MNDKDNKPNKSVESLPKKHPIEIIDDNQDINDKINDLTKAIAESMTNKPTIKLRYHYYLNRMMGMTQRKSAVLAGYSHSYSHSGGLPKDKDCPEVIIKELQKHFSHLRDQFKNKSALLLPMIFKADCNLMNEVQKDTELYVKAQPAIRRIQSNAGLVNLDNEGNSGNTIMIGQIQAYISQQLKIE